MSYKWYDGQRVVNSLDELKAVPTTTMVQVPDVHGDGFITIKRNLSKPHAGSIAVVLNPGLACPVEAGENVPEVFLLQVSNGSIVTELIDYDHDGDGASTSFMLPMVCSPSYGAESLSPLFGTDGTGPYHDEAVPDCTNFKLYGPIGNNLETECANGEFVLPGDAIPNHDVFVRGTSQTKYYVYDECPVSGGGQQSDNVADGVYAFRVSELTEAEQLNWFGTVFFPDAEQQRSLDSSMTMSHTMSSYSGESSTRGDITTQRTMVSDPCRDLALIRQSLLDAQQQIVAAVDALVAQLSELENNKDQNDADQIDKLKSQITDYTEVIKRNEKALFEIEETLRDCEKDPATALDLLSILEKIGISVSNGSNGRGDITIAAAAGDECTDTCNIGGIGVYVWVPSASIESYGSFVINNFPDGPAYFSEQEEDNSGLGRFVVRPNDRTGGTLSSGGEAGRWVSVIPMQYWNKAYGIETIQTHIISHQDCESSCANISTPITKNNLDSPNTEMVFRLGGNNSQTGQTRLMLNPSYSGKMGRGIYAGTYNPLLGYSGDTFNVSLSGYIEGWTQEDTTGPSGAAGCGVNIKLYCGPPAQDAERITDSTLINMSQLLCSFDIDLSNIGSVVSAPEQMCLDLHSELALRESDLAACYSDPECNESAAIQKLIDELNAQITTLCTVRSQQFSLDINLKPSAESVDGPWTSNISNYSGSRVLMGNNSSGLSRMGPVNNIMNANGWQCNDGGRLRKWFSPNPCEQSSIYATVEWGTKETLGQIYIPVSDEASIVLTELSADVHVSTCAEQVPHISGPGVVCPGTELLVCNEGDCPPMAYAINMSVPEDFLIQFPMDNYIASVHSSTPGLKRVPSSGIAEFKYLDGETVRNNIDSGGTGGWYLEYQPEADFNGIVDLEYSVIDDVSGLESNDAEIYIDIIPQADMPMGFDDTMTETLVVGHVDGIVSPRGFINVAYHAQDADDVYGTSPSNIEFNIIDVSLENDSDPEMAKAPIYAVDFKSVSDWKGNLIISDQLSRFNPGTLKFVRLGSIQVPNNWWGIAKIRYTVTSLDDGLTGPESTITVVVDQPITYDCAGEPDGTAFTDECGNCVGGITGLEPCIQDCSGEWGGSKELDECGACLDKSDPNWNAECTDCEGVVNGSSEVDNCNVCGGGGLVSAEAAGTIHDGSTTISLDAASETGTLDIGTSYALAAAEVLVGELQTVQYHWKISQWIGEEEGTMPVVDESSNRLTSFTILEGCTSISIELDVRTDCINTDVTSGSSEQWGFSARPVDCNGDPDGTAFIDDCGECAGGNTGNEPSAVSLITPKADTRCDCERPNALWRPNDFIGLAECNVSKYACLNDNEWAQTYSIETYAKLGVAKAWGTSSESYCEDVIGPEHNIMSFSEYIKESGAGNPVNMWYAVTTEDEAGNIYTDGGNLIMGGQNKYRFINVNGVARLEASLENSDKGSSYSWDPIQKKWTITS